MENGGYGEVLEDANERKFLLSLLAFEIANFVCLSLHTSLD